MNSLGPLLGVLLSQLSTNSASAPTMPDAITCPGASAYIFQYDQDGVAHYSQGCIRTFQYTHGMLYLETEVPGDRIFKAGFESH